MIKQLYKILGVGVLVGALMSFTPLNAAPVPGAVNLQVVVGNDSGPIDGYKRVKVLLYNGDTAQSYEETHKSVEFVGGHGVIPIGSVVPLDPLDFDIITPNLRLIIEGEEAYVTLNSVPYALRAGHAERTAEELPLTTLLASENVIVGTPSENGLLHVSGDAHISNDLIVFENVGIGTANPTFDLDVAGTINVKSIYLNGVLLQTASNNATLEDLSLLHPSTGNIIVGDGTDFITASGNAARHYLGLGSSDSPYIGGLFVATRNLQVTQNQVRMFTSDTRGLLNVATNNLVVNDTGVGIGVAVPSGSLHVGTSTLFVNNGRVGVGTTAPEADLHVSGDLKVDGSIISDSFIDDDWSISSNIVYVTNSKFVGIGTSRPKGPLHIQSTEPVLDVTDTLPNLKDTFIVTRNRVGVGTTAPDGLLHIKTPIDSPNHLFPKARFFWVQEGSATHFVVDQAGNVGIGNTSSPTGKFQVRDANTNVLMVKNGKLGVGGTASNALDVFANGRIELSVASASMGVGTSNAAARLHVVSTGNSTDRAFLLEYPSANRTLLSIKNNGNMGIGTANTTAYSLAVSPTSVFLNGLTVTGSSFVMANPSYNWGVNGAIQITSLNIITSQPTGNRWGNDGSLETTGTLNIRGDYTHTFNGTVDFNDVAAFNLVGDITGLSNTVHVNRVNVRSLYNSSGTVVTINEGLHVTGDVVIGNPTLQFSHPDSSRRNLYLDGNLVVDGSIIQNMGMVNSMVDLYVSGNSYLATVTTANAAIGTLNPRAKLEIVASSNSASEAAFLVVNQASSELFRVNNDGQVIIGSDPAGVGLIVTADARFGGLVTARNGLTVTGSAISLTDGLYTWDTNGEITVASLNIYGSNNAWSSSNMTVASTLNITNTGTHTIAGTVDMDNVAAFTLVGNITGPEYQIELSTADVSYLTNSNGDGITVNERLHILNDVLIGSPIIRDQHPDPTKRNLYVDGNLIVDGTIAQSMGMLNSMVDLRVSGDATLATITTANVSIGATTHPSKLYVLASSNVSSESAFLIRNSDSASLLSVANDGAVKLLTSPNTRATLEVAGTTNLNALVVTGGITAATDETINGVDIHSGGISDVVSLNFALSNDSWSSTGVSVSTQITVPTLNVTNIILNSSNKWLSTGVMTVSKSISVATLNIGAGANTWGNDGSLQMQGQLRALGSGTHYINGTLNPETITSFNLSGDIVGGSQATIKVATVDVAHIFNSGGTQVTINEALRVVDDVIIGSPTIQFGHSNVNKANMYLDGNLVVEGTIIQQGGMENAIADLRVSGDAELALDSGASVAIGTSDHFATLGIIASSNSSSDEALWVKSLDGNPLFYVRNDGKVAVGTTNVQSDAFFVAGAARVSGAFATSGSITAPTDETINGVDISNGAISDVTSLTLTTTLNARGGDIRLSRAGSDGEQNIYFFDGTATNEFLRWDNADDRFEFSNDLDVYGAVSANNNIYLRAGNGNGDQFIYFYDDNSAQNEYIQWNNGVGQDYFELSSGVVINGSITANTTQTINGININSGAVSGVTTLNVTKSLQMHGDGVMETYQPIRMSLNGGVGSTGLYFFDDSSATNEKIFWNDTYDRFDISNDLHVTGNSDVSPALEVDALGNSNGLWVTVAGTGKAAIFETGSVGVGTTAPRGVFHVKSNSSDTLVVTNNQVGINTATPFANYALHVNGDVRVDGSIVATALGSNIWDISGADIYTATPNRVGIGISTPGAKLEIRASNNSALDASLSVLNNSYTSLFHIQNDGNVGIGTDTPDSIFHVGSEAGPVIFGNNDGVKRTIKFIPHDSTDGKTIIQVGKGSTDTAAILQISRLDDSASNIDFLEVKADNTYFLGNVGIGVTNPDKDLDIVKNDTTDAEISLVNEDPNAATILTLGANDSVLNAKLKVDAASDDFLIRTTTAHPLKLGTNDTDRIIITSAGHVGIGTNPSALFHVDNGTVDTLVVSENVVGIGTTNPSNVLHLKWDGGDASYTGKHGVTIENQNTGLSQSAELNFIVGPAASTAANVDLNVIRVGLNNPAFTIDMEGTERLRLNNNGFLGIQTTNPIAPLHVHTTGGDLLMVTQNQVMVSTSNIVQQLASAGQYTLAVDGTSYVSGRMDVGARYDNPGNVNVGLYVKDDIYVSGNIVMTGALTGVGNSTFLGDLTVNGTFTNPSDARYKQNIQTQSNALDTVMKLRPVSYEFNQEAFPGKGFPEGQHMGLIAQELEHVYPDLVVTHDDGYKSVNYIELISVLVRAVQEQQDEINQLKKELHKEAQ